MKRVNRSKLYKVRGKSMYVKLEDKTGADAAHGVATGMFLFSSVRDVVRHELHMRLVPGAVWGPP